VANILAQITFTLNRLFTEWYRSRGKTYDITNHTGFDQYFVYGRDIFERLGRIVDQIFNNFLKRAGRAEPYFSIYYDGRKASCCGMSQWGSQGLALRGYTPIQILRTYYPKDIDIYESTNFANHQESYPGYPLREGSSGEPVRTLQVYLNRISGDFWMPNVGRPDGVFGRSTRESVIAFQRIFNLVPDGVVGRITWYQLVRIYVAVKKLAELNSEGKRIGIGNTPPTAVISLNARGENVVELQFLINYISQFYSSIPYVPQDGVFRQATRQSVIAFQNAFGLTADGVVGPATWRRLYEVFHNIQGTAKPPPPPDDIPPFPGVPMRVGDRGSAITLMQNYLNVIRQHYPNIPALTADGIFGPITQSAVLAFQTQFGLTTDGVIGSETWYKIVEVYNRISGTAPPPPPPPPPPTDNPPYPGTALRVGARGENVRIMQSFLNDIGRVFPVIPPLTADGAFGPLTQNSVIAFQRLFGLAADGVIGDAVIIKPT